MAKKDDYLAGYADYRPPEEEMQWQDVPLYSVVRLADDSGWYLMDRGPEMIAIRKIFGGTCYRGAAPDKPATVVRQRQTALSKPWAFVGVPRGTEPLLNHLLNDHGLWEPASTHWKTLGRLHTLDHGSLDGGAGWTPHLHVL